jgi:hypothetical protein
MRYSSHVNLKNNLKLTGADPRPANPKPVAIADASQRAFHLPGLKARNVIALTSIIDPAGPGASVDILSRSVGPAQIALKMKPPTQTWSSPRICVSYTNPLTLSAAPGTQPTSGGLPTNQKPCKICPFSEWNRPEPSAKFFCSEGRSRGTSYCCRSSAESPYRPCPPDPNLRHFSICASTCQSMALKLQQTRTST